MNCHRVLVMSSDKNENDEIENILLIRTLLDVYSLENKILFEV